MMLIRVLSKFRRILSGKQKKYIIFLVLIMILGSFLETVSVSFILPFVEAMISPQEVMSNAVVRSFCDLFSVRDYRQLLMIMSLGMALVYLLKNAFLLFQLTIQNRFVFGSMFEMQKELLRTYLARPYEYYLGVNSGEILRVIGKDTEFAFNNLSYGLTLLSELVVSFALMLTVFVISPKITLAIGGLILLLVLLLHRIIRPFLKSAGVAYQNSYAGMYQWILQSIQGIKEVKISQSENYFEKKFEQEGKAYVRSRYLHLTLSVTPRYAIEAIAMSVFFVAMYLMIADGVVVKEILPVISVIAMVAIRLLPAANKISNSMAGMTFGEPALDKLLLNLNRIESYNAGRKHGARAGADGGTEQGLDRKAKTRRSICGFSDRIELQDISYAYPSGAENVLENVNVTLKRGLSFGIVGASGAGKTTLIDIALGLLEPRSGQVIVDGTDIREDISGWLARIGYIPQSIFMLDGSIRENVAFGCSEDEISDEKIWRALREASLETFVRSLPDGLDTQIGERGTRLSGGQRQRVGIARALYADPEILLFDEATSALDNETESNIMEAIHALQGKKTMIIIAHRLSTIEGCDVVLRVEDKGIRVERKEEL